MISHSDLNLYSGQPAQPNLSLGRAPLKKVTTPVYPTVRYRREKCDPSSHIADFSLYIYLC